MHHEKVQKRKRLVSYILLGGLFIVTMIVVFAALDYGPPGKGFEIYGEKLNEAW
jgi:hypothetical protein